MLVGMQFIDKAKAETLGPIYIPIREYPSSTQVRIFSPQQNNKYNVLFIAVDDLNDHSIDAGAAHIGETGFAAGLFYSYICINKSLLVDNLNGDEALANQAIKALTEAATKVAPEGKQNSFAQSGTGGDNGLVPADVYFGIVKGDKILRR